MAVYVDSGRIPYGRMLMSHMLADTVEELHAMADRVGLKRKWFQDAGTVPHYDLCQAKRAWAIELGAVVADRHRVVALIRAHRAARAEHQAAEPRKEGT